MRTAEAIDSPPTQAPFETFAFLAIAAGIVVAPVAAIESDGEIRQRFSLVQRL